MATLTLKFPPRVQDLMTRKPVCAPASASIREIAELLDENEISGLPIVDEQDRPIGVVSRTDLLRRLLEGPPGARRGEDLGDLFDDAAGERERAAELLGTAEDVMTPDPVVAGPEEAVWNVAHRMARERVHRVVVVDEDRRVIGMLTTLDLLGVYPV